MKTAQKIRSESRLLDINDLSAAAITRKTAETERNVALWKRALDLSVIFLALPTLLPLFLLIALVIRLVSPGPVFFQQERAGFMGRRFKLLKFRTMHPNADVQSHQVHLKTLIDSDQPLTKMDRNGDPRIISCGAFLRSSGLDELPQLINVWRGEMSLVGPRPCTTFEYEQLQPWHRQRFRVLPGLTGLWQVSGKNRTTFSEMNALDIYYAYNCSLWLDLKILFRTFPVLFSQVREMRGGTRKVSENL